MFVEVVTSTNMPVRFWVPLQADVGEMLSKQATTQRE